MAELASLAAAIGRLRFSVVLELDDHAEPRALISPPDLIVFPGLEGDDTDDGAHLGFRG